MSYRSLHLLVFLLFGSYAYIFNFNRALRYNKSFLKHQIRQEIKESIFAMFAMDIFHVPIVMLQINGHSLLYNSTVIGPGLWYEFLQYPLAILLIDAGNYWLHRAFHSPLLYSLAHKSHHRFVISTPFAAFAFHPLEACIMSLPNLFISFVVPLCNKTYILLLLYGNLETIMARKLSSTLPILGLSTNIRPDDSTGSFHTIHHINAKSNFGQLTTFWDHLMGTYMDPNLYLRKHGMFKNRKETASKMQ
ncbi:sterol delta 5-6-desaturase ERG3 [Penicillium taxi]|uniref:sterol delta 5-6-desaturase ERG3 n=1 Tax=Penicillium taxi TaxID=168475 RepID=UPI00254573B0|nr:sterol delta 5-6-desaturase ERG3 [Penicillium taxi]KAJ5887597.1 sterol delta 5-6-desaturase ERG3 [Penicillium taxi]